MEVLVNNKLYAVQPETTVTALLQFIQISSVKGIAVAINQHVVPKTDWPGKLLAPNDSVTIIQATQGG
jgi:sulfur carrier protein